MTELGFNVKRCLESRVMAFPFLTPRVRVITHVHTHVYISVSGSLVTWSHQRVSDGVSKLQGPWYKVGPSFRKSCSIRVYTSPNMKMSRTLG